jgi:DNA-binding IclR family transcriptional regulator
MLIAKTQIKGAAPAHVPGGRANVRKGQAGTNDRVDVLISGDRTQVGQRIPVMAPLASVFVAWAPEEDVRGWLLRGGAPPADRQRKREILVLVRKRVYSVALEVPGRRKLGSLLGELAEDPHSIELRRELRRAIEQLGRAAYQRSDADGEEQSVSTITAPVFGRHGEVSAAVTDEVFADAIPSSAVVAIGDRLLEATREISRAEGRPD